MEVLNYETENTPLLRSNHRTCWQKIPRVVKYGALFVAIASVIVGLIVASAPHEDVNVSSASSGDEPKMTKVMELIRQAHAKGPGDFIEKESPKSMYGRRICEDGHVGSFPCDKIDLMSFISTSDLGSAEGSAANDIWGWTDPATGREYAITGQEDGSSYVDITDPEHPLVLGFLPSNSEMTYIWRDIKTYRNHAYIVSENADHGLQVFDLEKLRDLHVDYTDRARFSHDTVYTEFQTSHNIFINEETGYLYAVGANVCNGGLHIVDITEPKKPVFSACFASDGYTHDVQCVVYRGPDQHFSGREICFAYNEDHLAIIDVEDKTDIKIISRGTYATWGYTHQGWLTEDHKYLLLDDELDEYYVKSLKGKTRTYVWDVQKLDGPINTGYHESSETTIDHNLYIRGRYSFNSNYESGLRILDTSNIACEGCQNQLNEVAYFDVRPESNTINFWGTWSNYPFYSSGIVVVSSIERGLFVLKPTFETMS